MQSFVKGSPGRLGQGFHAEEKANTDLRENVGSFWVTDNVLFLDLCGSYNSPLKKKKMGEKEGGRVFQNGCEVARMVVLHGRQEILASPSYLWLPSRSR